LLAFGTRSTPRYVLIDCGVHMRQSKGSQRMTEVMADIVAATGNQLDAVVATHEHVDHLSGFVQKGSPFVDDSVKVGQFWAAWTESPDDSQAKRLRRHRSAARSAIREAIKRLRARGAGLDADRLDGLVNFDSLTGELGVASGNGKRAEDQAPSTSAIALAWLAQKAERVKYCEPGEVLTLDGVEQLRAYVLGPPREETLLARDVPSGGKQQNGSNEVYMTGAAELLGLRLALDADGSLPPDRTRIPEHTRFPFDRSLRRMFPQNGPNASKAAWWQEAESVPLETRRLIESYFAQQTWRHIESDWLSAAEELALNLDSDTNNTSLVLAFEWGRPGSGQVFLFAADAQVGNWLSWRDQAYRVGRTELTADDLLRRTVFYKVGHHGSHNATMKRDTRSKTAEYPRGVPYGLELMSPKLLAYIPVDRAAVKKPVDWHMPHPPMYKALLKKAAGRVLRADGLRREPGVEGSAACPPENGRFAPLPGLPDVQWRESQQRFATAPKTPLYYEVLFRRP
jgi:hypothetical protein